MKKILLLAAATAVVLSSCSKNEIVDNSTDTAKAIGFTNYIGTSTKAVVTDKDVVNAEGSVMGVYASYETTDADGTVAAAPGFMSDVSVTYSSTSVWEYSPLKYWPTTGYLDFYAYWPKADAETGKASAVDATDAAGPVVTFTQAYALADMKDFVYATANNQTYDGLSAASYELCFGFQHALSRIAFSAKPADGLSTSNTFIKVTGLKVTASTDVVNQGTLTFAETSATIAAVAGTKYSSEQEWEISSSDTPLPLYTIGEETAVYTVVSSAVTLVNTDANNYIFLVPQKIAEGGLQVEVTFDIVYCDSDNKLVSTISGNTKSVSIAEDFVFAQGTAYNFPLVVSPNTIVFGDVTVTAWGDENSSTTL